MAACFGSLMWWDLLFPSSSSSLQQLYESNSPPPNLDYRSTMAPSSLRIFFLLLFLLDYIDNIIYDLHLSETIWLYNFACLLRNGFYCYVINHYSCFSLKKSKHFWILFTMPCSGNLLKNYAVLSNTSKAFRKKTTSEPKIN